MKWMVKYVKKMTSPEGVEKALEDVCIDVLDFVEEMNPEATWLEAAMKYGSNMTNAQAKEFFVEII